MKLANTRAVGAAAIRPAGRSGHPLQRTSMTEGGEENDRGALPGKRRCLQARAAGVPPGSDSGHGMRSGITFPG